MNKAELEANCEPKTSCFSYILQKVVPEELHMRGKLEDHRLQETALTKDENV